MNEDESQGPEASKDSENGRSDFFKRNQELKQKEARKFRSYYEGILPEAVELHEDSDVELEQIGEGALSHVYKLHAFPEKKQTLGLDSEKDYVIKIAKKETIEKKISVSAEVDAFDSLRKFSPDADKFLSDTRLLEGLHSPYLYAVEYFPQIPESGSKTGELTGFFKGISSDSEAAERVAQLLEFSHLYHEFVRAQKENFPVFQDMQFKDLIWNDDERQLKIIDLYTHTAHLEEGGMEFLSEEFEKAKKEAQVRHRTFEAMVLFRVFTGRTLTLPSNYDYYINDTGSRYKFYKTIQSDEFQNLPYQARNAFVLLAGLEGLYKQDVTENIPAFSVQSFSDISRALRESVEPDAEPKDTEMGKIVHDGNILSQENLQDFPLEKVWEGVFREKKLFGQFKDFYVENIVNHSGSDAEQIEALSALLFFLAENYDKFESRGGRLGFLYVFESCYTRVYETIRKHKPDLEEVDFAQSELDPDKTKKTKDSLLSLLGLLDKVKKEGSLTGDKELDAALIKFRGVNMTPVPTGETEGQEEGEEMVAELIMRQLRKKSKRE